MNLLSTFCLCIYIDKNISWYIKFMNDLLTVSSVNNKIEQNKCVCERSIAIVMLRVRIFSCHSLHFLINEGEFNVY